MNDEPEGYCTSKSFVEYLGAGFTVWCALPVGHESEWHESADYRWREDENAEPKR